MFFEFISLVIIAPPFRFALFSMQLFFGSSSLIRIFRSVHFFRIRVSAHLFSCKKIYHYQREVSVIMSPIDSHSPGFSPGTLLFIPPSLLYIRFLESKNKEETQFETGKHLVWLENSLLSIIFQKFVWYLCNLLVTNGISSLIEYLWMRNHLTSEFC